MCISLIRMNQPRLEPWQDTSLYSHSEFIYPPSSQNGYNNWVLRNLMVGIYSVTIYKQHIKRAASKNLILSVS